MQSEKEGEPTHLFFFSLFFPSFLATLTLLDNSTTHTLPRPLNTTATHYHTQMSSPPGHLHKCTDITVTPVKTTIHFSITDKVGALDECLAAIKAMNISLTRIES